MTEVITTNTVRKPAEGKTFIATYGSLRRGKQNYRVNESGCGKFVGLGVTEENYNLYRYSGSYFPSVSMTNSDNNTPVVVDVFEAPIDGGLTGAYDALEGYPNFYNRTKVNIKMDDGSTLEAWIYHIDEDQDEVITSGDWCLHNNDSYYEELANGYIQ